MLVLAIRVIRGLHHLNITPVRAAAIPIKHVPYRFAGPQAFKRKRKVGLIHVRLCHDHIRRIMRRIGIGPHHKL